jgi:hypothetical protein
LELSVKLETSAARASDGTLSRVEFELAEEFVSGPVFDSAGFDAAANSDFHRADFLKFV